MTESMRLASEVVKVLNLDDSGENRGRYYSPRAKKKTNVEKKGPWHRNLTSRRYFVCHWGFPAARLATRSACAYGTLPPP